MSIYAISDLHLPLSADKPMEVFGRSWDNYTERLRDNWQSVVLPSDTVLIPGDVSWAMYIKNAFRDFDYIEKLNGRKIISKGNHDYWWETVKKLGDFTQKNGFCSIDFLHNNAFPVENSAICGTKGYPAAGINPKSLTGDEARHYSRELNRLEISILAAKKLNADRIIAMLHYPPGEDTEFSEMLKEHGVSLCVYGHLHGRTQANAVEGVRGGVMYKLVSCDYMEFMPYLL